MRKSTGCPRLLLACVVVAAASWGSASARCTCSDVQPRVAHDGPPLEEGCIEQRRFGKCEADFMFNTIVELEAGYCQITCGRCDCCSTVEDLALDLGLVELVTALRIAGMGEEFLTNPGWMTSILAPQDGALSSWLAEKGWTWASVEAVASQRGEMEEMLSLHILPPVQPINSVWTTPFFLEGVVVPSLSEEHSLVAGRNPATGRATLSGPVNTVTILEGDKEFCKGFIHIVDNLLLLEVPVPAQPITSTRTINETQVPATGTATNNTAAKSVILHEKTPLAKESPEPESVQLVGEGSDLNPQMPPRVDRANSVGLNSEEPSSEVSGDREGVAIQPPSVESGDASGQPETSTSAVGNPQEKPRNVDKGVSGGSRSETAQGEGSGSEGGVSQSQSDSGTGSGTKAGDKKKSSSGQGPDSKKPTNTEIDGSKGSQQKNLSEVEELHSPEKPKKDSSKKSNGDSTHLG